jgi:hypothetical protein
MLVDRSLEPDEAYTTIQVDRYDDTLVNTCEVDDTLSDVDDSEFELCSDRDFEDAIASNSDTPWQVPPPIIYSLDSLDDSATCTKLDVPPHEPSVYHTLPIVDTATGEPWIRLLQFTTDHDDPQIHCELVRRPVFDAPKYTALSYAWGANDQTSEIFIGENETSMTISQHLWKALRRLREACRDTVYVWVDRICINQEDLIERAAQVSIMAQVYNQATQVRIWLGEDPSITYNTIDDLSIFFILCQEASPWWKRLWILQECAYARACPMVMLGPLTMTLGELITRWSASPSNTWRAPSHVPGHWPPSRTKRLLTENLSLIRAVYSIWQPSQQNEFPLQHEPHRLSLLERLHETPLRHHTSPHDRIYALLSLISTSDARHFRPDYRRPFPELWLQAIHIAMTSPLWGDGWKYKYLIWQDPLVKAVLDPSSRDEVVAALGEAMSLDSEVPVDALMRNFWEMGGSEEMLRVVREAADRGHGLRIVEPLGG